MGSLKKRNKYAHNLWLHDLDTQQKFLQDEDRNMHLLPSENDLNILVDDIVKITNELNSSRLEGVISEALLHSAPNIGIEPVNV